MSGRLLIVRLAVTAVALLLYLPTLQAPFHFDDFSLLAEPSVTRDDGWRDLVAPTRTRPLTYLTFRLSYLGDPVDPEPFHLTNILLFAVTVWIAGSVYLRALPPSAATFALIVFALHPLQTEAVAYVYGRASLLAGLFCLASWRVWLSDRRWWAVALFGCAIAAKEEAAAWPLFLLAFNAVFRRGELGRSWRPLAAMAGLVALAASQALYATGVQEGAGAGLASNAPNPYAYLWSQPRTILLYIFLLLGYGQSFDHDLKLAGASDLLSWLCWLVLAGIVVALLRLLRRTPHAFWPLGALVLLLPSSSIVPLADLAAERRMFIPMISLAAGLGALLAWAIRRRQVLGMAVLAAALSLATSLRIAVWRSGEALWRDALEKSPQSVRAKLQLSRALAEQGVGAVAERRRLIEEALALRPGDPDTLTELGIFRLQQGEAAGAVEAFEAALDASPVQDPQMLANLAAALYNAGQRSAAERSLENALNANPCNFDARNNLLLIRRAQGRQSEAAVLAEAPEGCRFSGPQQEALERARRLFERR